MERTSRQSVVLDDRVLRERFAAEARDADKVVAELEAEGVLRASAQRWRAQLAMASRLLVGTPDTAFDRERDLAQQFQGFEVINTAMSAQVQEAISQRNKLLEARLEGSRQYLTRQVTAAIVLAVAMAVVFGIWFTRPLRQLEQAIVGLGENRLDQAIAIKGPADLALVGQRLNWLRLRLVELDADKSRFLRHISHELKTPLASMREGVSLLEDGVAGELSREQREIAQILRHNTALLQSQIEDLLRFNTAAFEARQLRRKPTDLLQLLEEQVDAQRLQWRAREITVNVSGPATKLEIDPEKIGTVIANLLSNAIRYSPFKGTVRLEIKRLQGLVRIEFHDQGVGVALADRERIFEPFYRGERQPPDVARGSGIGLSIVQEYVAAHGGRIELLPEESGAHFRIELPHVFKS
jgi:two-component system, NtrC family, sensor histidine kinase GlrK